MQFINLKALIEELKLDVNLVASELFPGIKYPKLALGRILSGEAFLDSQQISRLALFTGLNIQDLYALGGWKLNSDKSKVFTTISPEGDYRAELNTDTWALKIFHKNSIFHEESLVPKALSISDYITYISRKIEQNQKQK